MPVLLNRVRQCRHYWLGIAAARFKAMLKWGHGLLNAGPGGRSGRDPVSLLAFTGS